MIKKIIFILICFLFNFFIFTQNKINEDDIVLLKAYFPKELIFNKKHLLRDLTNDMQDYLKNYDNSADVLLNSQDFIYSEDQINYIYMIEDEFKKNIFDELNSNLENEDININLVKEEDNSNGKFSHIIEISLYNYTEGEYNLISNIPSKIFIKTELFEKDNDTSIFSYKKNYKQIATIEFPTELLRLKKIVGLLINDFIKRIKPLYIKN